jgi:hypothetical protein
MNTNDVEFVLTMITLGTLSLAVLIYVSNWLLQTITTPDVPVALRISNRTRHHVITRRRANVIPGIICSLPIHQKGRPDDIRI